MKNLSAMFVLIILVYFFPVQLSAQLENIHGNQLELKRGVHDMNQVRTSFYNDGMIGKRNYVLSDIAGEWPSHSGHVYFSNLVMFMGAEVIDKDANIRHIISESHGSSESGVDAGDINPVDGTW